MVSRNPRQKRRPGGRGRRRWRAATSLPTTTTSWTRARTGTCRPSPTPTPSTATVSHWDHVISYLWRAAPQACASGQAVMLAVTTGLSSRSTWGRNTCWTTRAPPRPGSRCRSCPSWSFSFRRWELCKLISIPSPWCIITIREAYPEYKSMSRSRV